MPIFSFSIKPKEQEKLKLINRLKQYAEDKGINFSSIVINSLQEYEIRLKVREGKTNVR